MYLTCAFELCGHLTVEVIPEDHDIGGVTMVGEIIQLNGGYHVKQLLCSVFSCCLLKCYKITE
jgi:hypothetical protein